MNSTKFGNYLVSLRIQRNYKSISLYLNDYKLPISEGYYRELETGKSLPSLDMAAALYKSLQADSGTFYNFLLQDLLPSHIVAMLAPISGDEPEDSVSYKDCAISPKGQDSGNLTISLNSEASEFFKNHTHLLPILMFIYGHNFKGVTKEKLERFIATAAIDIDYESIINYLLQCKLVQKIDSSKGSHRIAKIGAFLNLNDRDLENHYLANEFRDEYIKPPLKFSISNLEEFKDNSQYAFYSLFPISKEDYDVMIERVIAVCEELNFIPDSAVTDEEDEIVPLFFWSVISAKPDWLVTN